MDKNTLRQQFKSQLQNIKRTNDRNITQKLTQHPEYINSSSILVYVSTSTEVPTDELITYALRHGKTVLIPDTQALKVYNITDSSLLESRNRATFFVPRDLEVYELHSIGLAIIPGLAFTPQGDRLGRGRGWYDRFLTQYTVSYTIGLCYPEQVIDELPVEKHDVRVDEVMCF